MRTLSIHPALAAALGCLPLVAACHTTATLDGEAAGDAGVAAGADAPVAMEAIEAIQDGELERARDLLNTALVGRHLEAAGAELTAGRPEDALIAIDRALRIAPRDQRVLLAKARGSLALAEKKIADGGSAGLIEGAIADAREYYFACDPEPEALLGASRAALLAGDFRAALEHARAADAALTDEERAREMPFTPERVLAEAAFRAYTSARAAQDEDAALLFEESREALGRLLGRHADDPWAWGTLAELFEWEERFGEARDTLLRGLARMPDDPDLLERLARVARKEGGADQLLATFEAYSTEHPDLALPRWYLAKERFEHATDELVKGFAPEDPVLPEDGVLTSFRRAEEEFRACRETDPAFYGECVGYEVMARAAAGWFHYQRDELEAAEQAFLSMNELVDRGLEWSIEGRLLSGVQGLHLVGTRYNDREEWEEAARVYAKLHDYQPGEAVWANNTGFFYRDAAVRHELRGKLLCRAARGEDVPEELLARALESAGLSAPADPVRLDEAADREMEKARALMEESVEAYLDAARLADEDVRVVNDAALVLVYYQHTDLDLAEELLLRCVEMGARQLEDESLDDDARWELENAWGDAHQNLGVLYAVHRDDPETARTWLAKAVEIGPEPRPLLSSFWIPLLDGELSSSDAGELYALATWGDPCSLD